MSFPWGGHCCHPCHPPHARGLLWRCHKLTGMMPPIPFLQPLQPLQKPPKDRAWSIHPGIQRDGSPCSAFLEPCGFKLLPWCLV